MGPPAGGVQGGGARPQLSASSSHGADVPDPTAAAEPLVDDTADAPPGPDAGDASASDASAGATPVGETPAGTEAVPPRKLKLFAAVALAVLAADQLTKAWAVANLDGGRIVDVVGSLRFELAYNTGASFSLGSGRGIGPWVTVIALGMVLALAVPHPMAALAGFALVGLGFANMVPVLFSAAGQLPGIAPAQGIAAVASVGYFGMMAGPPLIGFIAEARSLAAGLLVVVFFAVVVAALARRALGGARPA